MSSALYLSVKVRMRHLLLTIVFSLKYNNSCLRYLFDIQLLIIQSGTCNKLDVAPPDVTSNPSTSGEKNTLTPGV